MVEGYIRLPRLHTGCLRDFRSPAEWIFQHSSPFSVVSTNSTFRLRFPAKHTSGRQQRKSGQSVRRTVERSQRRPLSIAFRGATVSRPRDNVAPALSLCQQRAEDPLPDQCCYRRRASECSLWHLATDNPT